MAPWGGGWGGGHTYSTNPLALGVIVASAPPIGIPLLVAAEAAPTALSEVERGITWSF